MGARSKSNASKATNPRTGCRLLAPTSLETLVRKGDQRLGGVVPVPSLRPGDDQSASGKRQGLIQRKAGASILRPNPAVGIEENATRLVRALGIGPMLGRRRRQVAAVLSQIEARLRLHEVLDVDQPELVAVIEELVVLVVTVRRDWLLRWYPFRLRGDLLQQVAQGEVDLRR